MILLWWIKLIIFNVFLCDRSYHFLYTSFLFLTDHGFWNYFYAFCIFLTLAFGTQYIVYKFRYGLLSNFEYIVGLESYLPIVEEKFCLHNEQNIFWSRIWIFLHFYSVLNKKKEIKVTQPSFLSKSLSFLPTLFWFQQKWQRFWKKWGLRNWVLKWTDFSNQ